MNQTLRALTNRTGDIADRVVLKLVQCGKKSLADIRHISLELWTDIWTKFIKRADTHVIKMQRALKPVLRKQFIEVLENIKKYPPPKVEESKVYKAELTPEQRRFINLWTYDRDKWRKEFMATGEPFILGGLVDGGKDALDKLGIDPADFVTDEAIKTHASKQALIMAKSVDDTMKEVLRGQFVEGLKAGESITDMMARIQGLADDMPEWKSRQIAQTEMISAINDGAIEGNKQSGVVWGTQWIGALDDRIRDSHREMTEREEAVPLGERFSNGLEYPGDSSGDPAESINCRCTTKPLTENPNESSIRRIEIKGGEGSGNFGHAGRPGEVGGSSEGGGTSPATWGERITDSERGALEEYSSSGYKSINSGLRSGNLSDADKARVENIDSALRKVALDKDTALYEDQRLYRAASIPEVNKEAEKAIASGNYEGFEFTEKGYTSTTTDKKIARDFQRDDDAKLFVIDAKAGTRAGSLEKISNFSVEKETLIARSTKYKINKIETVKEQFTRRNPLTGKPQTITKKIDYVHLDIVSQ